MTKASICIVIFALLAIKSQCRDLPLSGAKHNRRLTQASNSSSSSSSYPKITISAGVFTTGIIDSTGKLFCMGYNDDGAIGDNTRKNRYVPTAVKSSAKWRSFSGGDWHVMGVTTKNQGYGWGYNADGRLGTGKKTPTLALVPQRLPYRWRVLSAGHFHSCGVLTNGSAMCWGDYKNCRLGHDPNCTAAVRAKAEIYTSLSARFNAANTRVIISKPQLVVGGGGYSNIEAKGSHTCGMKGNSLYCWGGNTDGEIGNGKKSKAVPVPFKVPGNYSSFAIGLRFTCGITTNKQLYCTGAMRGGGTNMINTVFGSSMVKITTGGNVRSVTAGMQHACYVKTNGDGYCFGLGWHGQLGTGKRNDCSYKKPCKVTGGRKWSWISCGEYSTSGVSSTGQAFGWGEDVHGKLGLGTEKGFYFSPKLVVGAKTWMTV